MSRARIVGGLVLTGLVLWVSSLPVGRAWDVAASTWLQRAAPAPDRPAATIVWLGNVELEVAAAVLVGAVLLFVRRDIDHGRAALRLAVGLVMASLAAVTLKHLVVHPGPGPSLWRSISMPGLQIPTPYSFPSGHTLRVTLIAATVLRGTPLLAGAAVLAMMTALVYLGDHWTSDVLGGLALGWTFAGGFRALTLRERASGASAASPARPR